MLSGLFGAKKETTPQVLAPDFEAALIPVSEDEMRAAATITPAAMLRPDLAEFFILGRHDEPLIQLRGADGRPFLDATVQGAPARFYVFAPARQDDKSAPDLSPDLMLAFQCRMETHDGIVWVRPERLLRGENAYAVFSVSYPCCGAGAAPARTMLYADTSQSRGPFLNVAFASNAIRRQISNDWLAMDAQVLSGAQANWFLQIAAMFAPPASAPQSGARPGVR